MPRFIAPPPNGDSRRMLQQRSREATRPVVTEKKACWPFNAPASPPEQNRGLAANQPEAADKPS